MLLLTMYMYYNVHVCTLRTWYKQLVTVGGWNTTLLDTGENEAETHCMSLSKPRRSAHLVSVENQQEQNFTITYVKTVGRGIFVL